MHTFVTLCLALLALAAATQADKAGLKEKLVQAAKQCAEDTKVTPEQEKLPFTKDLPKDAKERCYLECIYKKLGIVKDGALSVEGCKQLALARFTTPEDIKMANTVTDVCASKIVKKDDECSLGYEVRDCFQKNGNGFMFFSMT